MGNRRPDFVIVCDHGNRGGQLDPVTRLPWFSDLDHWWAHKADDVVRITPLEDDRKGWRPERLVSGYQEMPGDAPRRMHFEIPCPTPGCTRRAYRGDTDKLDTLLHMLATDQRFRDTFTVSATETEIVITLDALNMARDTARTRCHLNV